MLLAHARALSHTSIHQSSSPETVYHKTAVVPNEEAEDWEPMPFIPEPTVVASYREDGKAIIEEDPND